MYRRARVRIYECGICGETAMLLPKRHGYGPMTYKFPDGWIGSYMKNGICLCPRCAKAYMTARGFIEAEENDEDK